MPQRTHRPGLTRTHSHSRSASGSSSKLALNLHFTQKDAIVPSKPDKAKRSSLGPHAPPRASSNSSRTTNTACISSRDNISTQPSMKLPHGRTRTLSDKSTNANGNGPRHKAGFTLASTAGSDDEEDDDDDEWVSSESGAVTPNNQRASSSDSEDVPVTTPQDNRQHPPPLPLPITKSSANPPSSPTIATPRAGPPPALLAAQQNESRQQLSTPQRHVDESTSLTAEVADVDPAFVSSSRSVPSSCPAPPAIRSVTRARPQTPPLISSSTSHSRTEPPTPTSPRPHRSKRSSATRPPSIISEHSAPLRPHPLFRGHSHGIGSANLASITISPAAAQAQLSSSPPASSGLITSHTLPPVSPVPSSASAALSVPFRRTSTSSVHSNATVPVQTQPGRTHDRTRALSTVSSTSSAALSSLAQLPSRASPRDGYPHALAQSVRFPPSVPPTAALHTLLPPPYVQPHLTILAWRTPIRESYDRVLLAKTTRRSAI